VQLIVERAGLSARIKKKVHPHMFRHSFTTHLFSSGADIVSVQTLLGHSRPETTLSYSHARKPNMFNLSSPLDDL
jgi:site-specific recombinase XerD